MDEDYEYCDTACPKCGHAPTHTRWCTGCDDGLIDEHEEDPVNYPPGSMYECPECCGTGTEKWCPKCGLDIQLHRHQTADMEGGPSERD